MKWIKASEPNKPANKEIVTVKVKNENGVILHSDGYIDNGQWFLGTHGLNFPVKYTQNVIEWLDETPAGEQQPVTGEQAEWEFLTIIRANRAILENAESKIAFPNHSPKTAALEVYDDMIEIISHLPAKRTGKEKQVADYVNSLPQPPTPEPAGELYRWVKASERLPQVSDDTLLVLKVIGQPRLQLGYFDRDANFVIENLVAEKFHPNKIEWLEKLEPQQNQDE